MRYQRCTLCRKTKISYSLVPFSSPCNRSSNFIVNHHVSVLFSLLSLSLSLFRSFFPSACVSFFVRVLRYTPSNSFHCRCLLSATITRRVKDPSGNVNPILSPSVSAPVRLEFPPLYLRSVSRTFIPLERFVVCPAGTCSFLILLSNIASSSLSSPWPRFLSLFFFSDFSPFLSPFVRLSSSFITPFVWKTIRARFLERFSTAPQQYDNKWQEFWKQSKTIYISSSALFLALTCECNKY